jgi:hypothetical protein
MLHTQDEPPTQTWDPLDYYVRRVSGRLMLVQTLMSADEESPEVQTVYIEVADLEPEWAEAVLEQGADLEDGKSCHFIPPEEDEFEEADDFEDDMNA